MVDISGETKVKPILVVKELKDKQELPMQMDIEERKVEQKKQEGKGKTVVRFRKDGKPYKRPGNTKGQILKNSGRDLAKNLTSRFTADFKKHGIAVIEQVRKDNPVEYLKVATRLLPKDVNLSIEHSFSDVLFEAHKIIQNRKYQEAIDAEINITDDD